MKAKDTKRKTRTGAVRRIGALLLALTMTFGTWTPAFAEEPVPGIEEPAVVETPAEETQEITPEVQATPAQAETESDGLEIGPEIVQDAVGQSTTVPTPTINDVSVDAKEVTGGGLVGSGQRKQLNKDCIIHVTVSRSGTVIETATATIGPKGGSKWSVSLQKAVQAGDVITATQEFNGGTSGAKTYTVKKLLKDEYKDKLQMPSGEILIEQLSAQLVDEYEQAEALRLLKEANPDIAEHITSATLKIKGTDSAWFEEIVYDDGSKTTDIQAPNLTLTQMTEKSRGFEFNEIHVVDNQITGKLKGEGPFTDIKVDLVLRLGEADQKEYCEGGKCIPDKNSSKPISLTVDPDTGAFFYPLSGSDELKLDQVVGLSVKEKGKLKICSSTTVKLAKPKKTEVRDPRKLTDADKTAIDTAIRTANTVDGVSKLPDGTGFTSGPAFIEFDNEGNVKIFSPNDVDVKWDNGNPIYQKK